MVDNELGVGGQGEAVATGQLAESRPIYPRVVIEVPETVGASPLWYGLWHGHRLDHRDGRGSV